MSQTEDGQSAGSRLATRLGNVWRGEGVEVGSRRARFRGMLSDVKDAYQANYAQVDNPFQELDEQEDPSHRNPKDASIVSNGEEEMILFPSYARHHLDMPARRREEDDPNSTEADTTSSTGAQAIHQHWDKAEDPDAVVDVDVRGWIYSPHRGPMNRRQRLYIGIARQMAGLPSNVSTGASPSNLSPNHSPQGSRATSPRPLRQQLAEHNARKEQRLVEQEANTLYSRAKEEGRRADRGEYSEAPKWGSHMSATDSGGRSKTTEANTEDFDDPDITMIQRRASWKVPADMSPQELSIAQANLMTRLRPFYATHKANAPVSAIFYDDKNTNNMRHHTVYTNQYGQFALRAALNFVPTNVKIITEDLYAEQAVKIIESNGVSVISDIDDTIKHTAMLSGVREAFRNAFLRGICDLNIDGVKDWYGKLADLGVSFHYVSNSPWQLYPVLSQFFLSAGLPPGSLHLKQYSGMLQGIFEPVAERKKSTLDRIVRDFPERHFILVGDSGEADLEVYTDFVQENPGRVLGIFIRDVTTPIEKGFFDSNVAPGDETGKSHPRGSAVAAPEEDDEEMKRAIHASLHEFEAEEKRRTRKAPDPPPMRRSLPRTDSDLMCFSDDDSGTGNHLAAAKPSRPLSRTETSQAPGKKVPPAPPKKPAALRSQSSQSIEDPSADDEPGKMPRPLLSTRNSLSTSASGMNNATSRHLPKSDQSNDSNGYAAAAKQRLSTAYESLPSAPWSRYETSRESSDNLPRPRSMVESSKPDAPPPPPRRTITSYPAAAGSFISNRATAGANAVGNTISGYTATQTTDATGGAGRLPATQAASMTRAQINRIEMWRQRWATAQRTLKEKGVVLVSWRVGTDAVEQSVKLVKKAEELDRREKETKRRERRS